MIYCDLQTTAQMNAQILEYYWVSFLGFLFVLSNISTLTLFLRTVFKPFNNLPWPLSSFSPLPQTNTLCRACSSPKLAYYFPAPVLPGSCSVQLYQSDGVSKRPKPTSTRLVNLPPAWPSGYSLKGQKEFSPFSNGIYNGVLVQGPAGVQPVSL